MTIIGMTRSKIMRSFFTTLAVLLALAFVNTAAYAHFIWATIQNNQVRFALLESINEVPDAKFEKYVANLSPRSGGKVLTLGTPKEGARYAPLALGQNVVVVDSVIGAKEREGKTYLLVYHAKGAASLAAAGTSVKAPVDLQAHQDGRALIVAVRQNQKPVPHSEVWVQWPGQEAPKSLETDDQGNVKADWPETVQGGFVGIRAMVSEPTSGEREGKKYESVHHWTTLTFPVDGPKLEGPKADAAQPRKATNTENKPLTQLLREAYGSNHEIVGHAAFNQTLFAGQLTREQLETHLQQRALVHNEVHRILNAASQKGRLPYGAAQKNVLTLLFSDLIGMGSGWPTEAQARPLTRAFLREIRDSEKQGPYFALGVQHVYYGGITNGGRMIGKKIGDTLQFLPTYYEKSDGYREYLREVNKITDSAAQQEMLRGGQEVYKYIIASSNEDIFKTRIAQK